MKASEGTGKHAVSTITEIAKSGEPGLHRVVDALLSASTNSDREKSDLALTLLSSPNIGDARALAHAQRRIEEGLNSSLSLERLNASRQLLALSGSLSADAKKAVADILKKTIFTDGDLNTLRSHMETATESWFQRRDKYIQHNLNHFMEIEACAVGDRTITIALTRSSQEDATMDRVLKALDNFDDF